MLLRSLLFAPGNHARHAEKALASQADGAILDLEDAVAIQQKPAAREAVRGLLASHAAKSMPLAFVRVNAASTPFCYTDLQAIVVPGLDGIVLPKVESAAQVSAVSWLLDQLERERGLDPGSVAMLPIVETALGLSRVAEIVRASSRISVLNFGAGDFTLDTGMEWTPDLEGTLWARVHLVIASRAAGLTAPIDTVFPHLEDMESLRREAVQARRIGFAGKACIHPSQVGVVNEVFSPTPEETAWAQRVCDAFDEAEAAGTASIRVDGHFVDYPVAQRARRVLEVQRELSARCG